jgi:alpha-tubulin suppressor-like RCC1 family protein
MVAPTVLQDLPLEVLTHVCQHLGFMDLVRVARSCKRFRDGGLEAVELPIESPAVTVLCEFAFPRLELAPRMRPLGCSESWVAYLTRCVRQRRCREAPPIAAGKTHSLCLDAVGRLLTCGNGAAVGHGDRQRYYDPTPVAAMAGIQVRSVSAGEWHSLALAWDGRVFSWGNNRYGQLGCGDRQNRPAPVLVKGLQNVRGIFCAPAHSFAVTEPGAVFQWGVSRERGSLRPALVEGFEDVRVCRVCGASRVTFAIGEDEELFSWGHGADGLPGHGDAQDQPSPKRVEALRGARVSSVAVGRQHVLALAEDGLVYAWGGNRGTTLLGDPQVERELLPKPVEALRGVRVSSIAVAGYCSCAVAEDGRLWAWGCGGSLHSPLGHAEPTHCPLPKPIEALQGVKVDAVVVGEGHTLALAGRRERVRVGPSRHRTHGRAGGGRVRGAYGGECAQAAARHGVAGVSCDLGHLERMALEEVVRLRRCGGQGTSRDTREGATHGA